MALTLEKSQKKRSQKSSKVEAQKAASPKPRPWKKPDLEAQTQRSAASSQRTSTALRSWSFAPLAENPDQLRHTLDQLAAYGQHRWSETKKSIKKLVTNKG